MTKPQRAKCSHCGGTNILFDAYAAWNEDDQSYFLVSTHDNPLCEDCGGECSVEWVTIPAEERISKLIERRRELRAETGELLG